MWKRWKRTSCCLPRTWVHLVRPNPEISTLNRRLKSINNSISRRDVGVASGFRAQSFGCRPAVQCSRHLHSRMHTCMHANLRVYLPTYLPTYILTCTRQRDLTSA